MKQVTATILGLLLGAGLTAHVTAQPAHDDIGNAIVVGAVPYLDTNNNTGATLETDEATSGCADTGLFQDNTSVWYQFTPAADGVYEFNTDGSALDTIISVWIDGITSTIQLGVLPHPLTECGCNDDGFSVGSGDSELRLRLESGTTYYVRVSGFDGEENPYVLNISSPLAVPSNDHLENATFVDQTPFLETIDNTNASLEKNEALYTDSFGDCESDGADLDIGTPDFNSVWYRYRPSTDGFVTVDLSSSGFDTVLGIWTSGGGPSHPLVEQACDDDSGTGTTSFITDFAVTAGTNYYIRVVGFDAEESNAPVAAGKTSKKKLRRSKKEKPVGPRKMLAQLQINILGPTPLPVELLSFDAQTRHLDVDLFWQTGSEIANAGFYIERRMVSGSTFGVASDWQDVGFIEGAGTTSEVRTYTYRVRNLEPGVHVFRLRQIDFDGTFEYSPEVEATVEVPGSHYLSTAYPNPFNISSTFTLTLARQQPVRIELFDAQGRRVQLIHDGMLSAHSRHVFSINARDLPGGIYLYHVIGSEFEESRSVVLAE